MKTKIVVSQDKERVAFIREALKEKGGYCPCLNEISEDTKCMCKAFREQEIGECLCGLYEKIKAE